MATGVAHSRIPFPWEMPVGLPANGSIQIGNDTGLASGRTVTVYPICRNADQYCLFETGGYSAATWITYARSTTYTFSSDGSKTLYAAFRNPARWTIGDDESISATVTIDSTHSNGLISKILADIITILRADTTLQAYATSWNSTTSPHVIPGWRSEDPALSADGNRGRMPFVEVRTGPCQVQDGMNGYFGFDCVFQMRAWIEVNQDAGLVNREDTMNKFLWDIMEALNAYVELLSNPFVVRHSPVSLDPTTADGDSYRVGQLDLAVRAGAPLQLRTYTP